MMDAISPWSFIQMGVGVLVSVALLFAGLYLKQMGFNVRRLENKVDSIRGDMGDHGERLASLETRQETIQKYNSPSVGTG